MYAIHIRLGKNRLISFSWVIYGIYSSINIIYSFCETIFVIEDNKDTGVKFLLLNSQCENYVGHWLSMYKNWIDYFLDNFKMKNSNEHMLASQIFQDTLVLRKMFVFPEYLKCSLSVFIVIWLCHSWCWEADFATTWFSS